MEWSAPHSPQRDGLPGSSRQDWWRLAPQTTLSCSSGNWHPCRHGSNSHMHKKTLIFITRA
eukprot:4569300-Amphidinium_carterae.1